MLEDFFCDPKIGLPEFQPVHLVRVVHLDHLEQDLPVDDDEAIGPSVGAEGAEMNGRVVVDDVADEMVETELDLAPDVPDGLLQLLGLPGLVRFQLPDFGQSLSGCVPPFGAGRKIEASGDGERFVELLLGAVEVV